MMMMMVVVVVVVMVVVAMVIHCTVNGKHKLYKKQRVCRQTLLKPSHQRTGLIVEIVNKLFEEVQN
jgi:hypothetical protein